MKRIVKLIKYILNEFKQNIKLVNTSKPSVLIFIDMCWCFIVYGASPSNYYNFDFVNAKASERKTFVTHRVSERMMKQLNDPNLLHIMQNKSEFAEKYKRFFKRNYAISDTVSYEEFERIAMAESRIVCKPMFGGQGRGIKTFEITSENIKEIYEEVKRLHDYIIEEWIVQHQYMNSLYPQSVNPLRIQTVVSKGAAHCIAATVTIGRDKTFANASANAIFALVDIKTGKCYTDGCDYDYNTYVTHPTTGVKIKNIEIPFWEETIELVKQAAMVTPEIGYVGWDVAISENGPVIIEGNNDPGYTAYQLHLLTGEHKGTYELFKNCLS